jgi:hypothetical protein
VPKFIKKPIPVDAVQFNRLGDHPSVFATDTSPTGFAIFTLEHTRVAHEVTPGDWILTGVEGENWPVKDTIFRATYSAVEGAA